MRGGGAGGVRAKTFAIGGSAEWPKGTTPSAPTRRYSALFQEPARNPFDTRRAGDRVWPVNCHSSDDVCLPLFRIGLRLESGPRRAEVMRADPDLKPTLQTTSPPADGGGIAPLQIARLHCRRGGDGPLGLDSLGGAGPPLWGQIALQTESAILERATFPQASESPESEPQENTWVHGSRSGRKAAPTLLLDVNVPALAPVPGRNSTPVREWRTGTRRCAARGAVLAWQRLGSCCRTGS